MESIYERIKSALNDEGVLPEEFVLRPQPEDGMRFADGAIDGTIRYYMQPSGNTDIAMLTQALKLASDERFEDAANALLTYFAQGMVMLPLMDRVQEWAYEHAGELSPGTLGRFALTLLTQSKDVESVKFALTVLEILEQEMTEDLRELLLTLATCEELTLFCLFVLGNYDDANEIYFALAQKLKGWGRIHAVSMLKPETQEMADWLLAEGWHNKILPEYSAITVIKRTKLVDRLQRSQDAELLKTAGELIGYSLADEPIAGLSKYKRTGELLQIYLGFLKDTELDDEAKERVGNIKSFVEKSELNNKWQLVDMCNGLLG